MKKLAIILVALSLLVGLGYGQSQAQAPVNQMAIDPGTIGDLLLFAPYEYQILFLKGRQQPSLS